MESSHTQYLVLSINILVWYICPLINQYNTLLLIKCHTFFIFSYFFPNVHFLLQDPFQDTTLHLVIHVSLGSSRLSVSQTYFWWPWHFWASVVRYFVELSLSWGLCNVFLMIILGLNFFLEENHIGKVPFSLHYVTSTYYQYDFSLLILTLITWLR